MDSGHASLNINKIVDNQEIIEAYRKKYTGKIMCLSSKSTTVFREEKKMDSSEVLGNHYFILNKKLCMIVCLWPYQNRSLKLFVRIFIVVSIYSMMIPQIIRGVEEIHEEHINVAIVVENFAGFLYFKGVLAKFCTCIYAENKLQHLFVVVTRSEKEIRDEEEKAVLYRSWNFARLLTIVYMIYMFVSGICFVSLPSIIPTLLDVYLPKNVSRPKAICYYAEYYVDQQEYFLYLYLHTSVCVYFTLLIVCAVDTTFIGCVYHALGTFNILMYVNLIQHTYTECFFFVTGLILMCLSVGSIDIMMNLNNLSNLFRIGFVFIGLIMYLFYVSWPGQRLLDTNEVLFQSIYSCGWYNLPHKTQCLLKFMMIRCTVPCQLTAGPLLQMNFANCGIILKTALSYFTVVASFS